MKLAKRSLVLRQAAAPLVTLLVICALEAFARSGILQVAHPAWLALIAVMYAGYSAGLRAGLISAALVVLYALYFLSAPGAPLQFSGDDATRMAVIALVAPFIAWMTGSLKDRAERALRQQIDAHRAHVEELQRVERGMRNLERPPRLGAASRDLTQRRRAEQALQDNEGRLRLITDAVPAMIVYVDAELRYGFCNRRYCEAMGRDESEILGRTVREVVGEEQFEVSRPWLERALAGEQAEHERRQPWADGSVADLSVTYVPHVGGDGRVRGLYALLVDLTERKRAERVKERYVSMVSHELRTPLASIIWSLNVLAENQSGGMSQEEVATVAEAQQNAERMLQLADEILEIEAIDQGELRMNPRVVALPELVERALVLNNGLAQAHGVRLAAAQSPAAEVFADPYRLMQVLSNLISNAAKHSPRGGRVDIAIERRGAVFRVRVRDGGRGVPEDFRDRLFVRFAQSREGRALGGTGLGLAICKEIVERSGGAIGYEPAAGGGAVFWFELPAARGGGL